MQLKVTKFQSDQFSEIILLIEKSILSIPESLYNLNQKNAWIKKIKENEDRLLVRLNNQETIICSVDKQLIGMASLRANGYLDFLYVHPDYQRKNIATILYTRLELEAQELGLNELVTDASKAAVQFFEYVGMQVIGEKSNQINEQVLLNYRMTKSL